MREPLIFVIDTEPLDDEDFDRTMRKVKAAVQELTESGVQVKTVAVAVGGCRDEVLMAIENG